MWMYRARTYGVVVGLSCKTQQKTKSFTCGQCLMRWSRQGHCPCLAIQGRLSYFFFFFFYLIPAARVSFGATVSHFCSFGHYIMSGDGPLISSCPLETRSNLATLA